MSLTAKAIADLLGIPPTTIRTWADRYSNFIPSKENKNGRRQYNDEAIVVFKRIGQLHKENLIGEQVKEALEKEFPATIDGDLLEQEGRQETGLIPYQQFNDMLQFFKGKFQQDSELIEIQRQELKEIKEQTALLKQALGLGQNRQNRQSKKRKKVLESNGKKPRGKMLENVGNKPSKRLRDSSGRFKKKGWFERLLYD